MTTQTIVGDGTFRPSNTYVNTGIFNAHQIPPAYWQDYNNGITPYGEDFAGYLHIFGDAYKVYSFTMRFNNDRYNYVHRFVGDTADYECVVFIKE